MKPFRATYQRVSHYGEVEYEAEEVLVIEILPPLLEGRDAEAVFVHPDGRLDQDYITRFFDCRIPWSEG